MAIKYIYSTAPNRIRDFIIKVDDKEDLVASILKNDLKQVILNTHKTMLKKYPKQKNMLDAMLKLRLEKLEKQK